MTMLSRPATLLVLGLSLLGGCAGLRIRDAREQVRIVEDLPYLPDGHEKHRLDLYLPKDRARFPMVLFVHGGFWRNQDRRYHQGLTGLYGNVGVALARRGIGVAVQSYRLSPGVGIEDQLRDVLAAARWVLAHAAEHGGDPERLILAGYSAGGHLVTLLGLDDHRLRDAGIEPGRVRGYVSLSGLLDVAAMAAGQDEAFNRDVTFRLFGRDAAGQARYSPASYLRADAPPLLLFAAGRDYPFVLQANRAAAARLATLGARATYREIAPYTHAGMVLNINSADDLVSEPMAAFVRAATGAP